MKKNQPPSAASYLIGEVSAKTGVHIETIRYYERVGVMPESRRNSGRQRLYDKAGMKRLDFIKRSRDLGYSLNEIRSLLSLADDNKLTCKQVSSITEDHLSHVQQKINDMQNIEAALSELLSKCSGGDVPECPIFDTLYGAYTDQ